MKKRILALALSLCMALGLMPTAALAAETEPVQVTVNSEGYIETDAEGNYPTGVSFLSVYYNLNAGYEYNFSGSKVLHPVNNYGTILSGSFHAVTNEQTGIISGGWFESFVTNRGTITAGEFDDLATNYATITGGTFKSGILNYGTVENLTSGYANVGDLGLTTKVLGNGEVSITQNGVTIPENAGRADEIYQLGFSELPVGLYLLTSGESEPTQNFEITDEFITEPVIGTTLYKFKMPDEAVTILAVFRDYDPNAGTTYTVTYTDGVDGEEIFADEVYQVAENETVPTYVPPEREGFLFDGWDPNYTATVTTDTTFTAKWREHISDGFTVTYTDGVADAVVFEDVVYSDISSGEATPPYEGTPTRPGFTFAGWSPEVAATVTGDAIYTAQWTENAPSHTHSTAHGHQTATVHTAAPVRKTMIRRRRIVPAGLPPAAARRSAPSVMRSMGV